MTSPAKTNIFENDIEIQASMKARASMFLLWPIYVTSCSDFASPSERIYLRGKMKYIAENLGVNQAVIVLKVRKDPTPVAVTLEILGLMFVVSFVRMS